jgi:hypothetical protein
MFYVCPKSFWKRVYFLSTNIDRESFYNQNYMADSQEDYPDSGDINITNTGVEKLIKNINPHTICLAPRK